MTPTFSLLHASYGRPEKAIAAMQSALSRAAFPKNVEYIFALNGDDPTERALTDALRSEPWIEKIAHFLAFRGDFAGSAPAWDAAAKMSTGSVLIQMQDDLELPIDWDTSLHDAMCRNYAVNYSGMRAPFFIAVSDGYRKDALCCTAIMSRAYYAQKGEFLHAGYQSVFSDDEVTYRALRDTRDGNCVFVDARHLVFRHRHHYHDKEVPMDSTYERENSAEAYRLGQALFTQRNPMVVSDGLKTW